MNHDKFYASVVAAFQKRNETASVIIPYTEDCIELTIAYKQGGFKSVEQYSFPLSFDFCAKDRDWRKTSKRLGDEVLTLILDKIGELKASNRRVSICGPKGSMLIDKVVDYL